MNGESIRQDKELARAAIKGLTFMRSRSRARGTMMKYSRPDRRGAFRSDAPT